jgi:hypothetical protein
MSTDFQTVMIRRNDLLHRKAIWQEVVDHLTKFLDTDAAPATVGIRTDAEGMVVPQDRIELAISEIKNGYMAEIVEELDEINKSEVAENVKQAKQGGKKKVPSKKASKKAGRRTTAARPSANKRKAGARK